MDDSVILRHGIHTHDGRAYELSVFSDRRTIKSFRWGIPPKRLQEPAPMYVRRAMAEWFSSVLSQELLRERTHDGKRHFEIGRNYTRYRGFSASRS